MHIAVTGASGFCGSHVARMAAARSDEVLCLSRSPGPVGRHLRWDAAAEVPDLANADIVIHCAAAVGDHPIGSAAESEQFAVNVYGTARLLQAAAGRPVVFVSSSSVYDPRLDRSHVSEDEHPTTGGHLNGYGRSKAAAELLALAAGAVVLRPRAVYGTGDRHLVPRLLAHARGGLLPLPGPDVMLSLTAVETLAEACLAAITWPPGAYNIADPEPYQRDATIRSVLRSNDRRARIVHVPLPIVRMLPSSSTLTPYAVDQLASTVVLDTTKARLQGFAPTRILASS